MKSILIVGCHSDDIEYGAGGLSVAATRFESSYSSVWWLVMTKGEAGGSPEVRKREQERSAKLVGAQLSTKSFQFKDTMLAETSSTKLIAVVEEVLRESGATELLLPFPKDLHQDHRALTAAGLVAGRWTENVLFYESFGTLGFQPEVFLQLSGQDLKNKMMLLDCHKSQCADSKGGFNLLESVKAIARFRGFQARTEYAEGYKSFRMRRIVT
jgi:LmbE family N-acetylglucosaminyl deacetylase